MPQKIIITVSPAGGGKFVAHSGGRQVCQRTYSPFLAAARTLKTEGYDLDIILIMRHASSDTDCLTSTIAEAASLAVMETQTQPPRFVPYQPFPDDENIGAKSLLGSGPDAFIAAEVAPVAPRPNNCPGTVLLSS